MGYSIICQNRSSIRTLVHEAKKFEKVFSRCRIQSRYLTSGSIRYNLRDKVPPKKGISNENSGVEDTDDNEEVIVDYFSTYKSLSMATKWEADNTNLNVDPRVKGRKNKAFEEVDNVFGLGDVKTPRPKDQPPIRVKQTKPKPTKPKRIWPNPGKAQSSNSAKGKDTPPKRAMPKRMWPMAHKGKSNPTEVEHTESNKEYKMHQANPYDGFSSNMSLSKALGSEANNIDDIEPIKHKINNVQKSDNALGSRDVGTSPPRDRHTDKKSRSQNASKSRNLRFNNQRKRQHSVPSPKIKYQSNKTKRQPQYPKSSPKLKNESKKFAGQRQFSTSSRYYQKNNKNDGKLNILEEKDLLNAFAEQQDTNYEQGYRSKGKALSKERYTDPIQPRISTNVVEKRVFDEFQPADIEYFEKQEKKRVFKIDHSKTRNLTEVAKQIIGNDILGTNYAKGDLKSSDKSTTFSAEEEDLSNILKHSSIVDRLELERNVPTIEASVILPRPEHPRIQTDTKFVKRRAYDDWGTPRAYNEAFQSEFLNDKIFKTIQSRNLGTLDTSKIVSPIDLTLSSSKEFKESIPSFKAKFTKDFETDNDYVTISKGLRDALYPKKFEKGDVVIIGDNINMGDRAIVVSSTDDEQFRRAMKSGMSGKRPETDIIILRMRSPMVDPMNPKDMTRRAQRVRGKIPKTFGARLEEVDSSLLVKTNHRVDFEFLNDPKIFDCFIDPIERPFVESERIIPELVENFRNKKHLHLFVGTGKSYQICPERC